MFVLFLVGLLYTWMRSVRMREAVIERPGRKQFWKRQLLIPHIILAAVMIGMFRFTNFWDFIIYFVVTGGVVLFTNIVQFEGKVKKILSVTVVQAVEIIVISYVVSLPFTLQFDSMFKGVGIAQNHSMIHQLLILWGLPVFLTVLLIICIIWEKLRGGANRSLYRLMKAISVPDLFVIIMGLCAIGLIVIPEFVYVRDIYESRNARANTMFKLTYQAYILFALMMSYILVFFVADRIKILQETKLDNRYEKKVRLSKVQITVGGMAIILLISTCGYFVNATTNWFTGFPLKNKYQTLNATAYIENAIPEDAAAIRWLNKNITGQPTVLEACGDSYKDYDNRVSAMTGLPTVLGWYVHEWLWRNNLDEENKRRTDVETIYTSTDKKEVQELLDKYEVNYIFIGSCEYQKYEGVNVALLSSLGEIVFKEENTMIVKL